MLSGLSAILLLCALGAQAQSNTPIDQCYDQTFTSTSTEDTTAICINGSLSNQAAINIIRECFGGNTNSSCVATAEQYIYNRCYANGVVIPGYNAAQISRSTGSIAPFTTVGVAMTSSPIPTPTLVFSTPLPDTSTPVPFSSRQSTTDISPNTTSASTSSQSSSAGAGAPTSSSASTGTTTNAADSIAREMSLPGIGLSIILAWAVLVCA